MARGGPLCQGSYRINPPDQALLNGGPAFGVGAALLERAWDSRVDSTARREQRRGEGLLGRIGFAKVGFVLLGVWLAVTTIMETAEHLRWAMPAHKGWTVLVYHVPLTALGVLIALWSDTLARRTTAGGEGAEGASLRVVDIQSTGIGLLGLWLLFWNVPRLLIRLSGVAEVWSTWGAEEDSLYAPGTLYREQIVVGMLSTALGLWLLLRSQCIARGWTLRLRNVASRPDSGGELATQPCYDFEHVQALAFSVFGLYLFADALPNLVVLGMRNGFSSPFIEQPVWKGDAEFLDRKSTLMTELLRAALGVAFFLGARGLAKYWHRARTILTSSASKPS